MLPIQNAVRSRYPPAVTVTIILLNCAIFIFEISLNDPDFEGLLLRFGLVPADLFDNGASDHPIAHYLPFLTHMFLHGSWLHLIFNMWTLWLFGPAIEDRIGPSRYIAFYLCAGLLAALTHTVFNPNSTLPTVGASGAIAGVMGCYVRLFPFARLLVVIPVLFFPFFFEIPAAIFAAFWFMAQIFQGTIEFFAPSTAGGVAWWAHAGGFVVGYVLTPALRRSEDAYRPYYGDEGIFGFDPEGRR